tara:strand:+ start:65 stop:1654 length:1590 start_codon:yes stop_codon:yes gene_type:complete
MNMTYSISKWDGLAKLSQLKISENISNMPTLFPVVDPKQQKFDIKKLKTEFKFNQVITSSYLMSKRIGHSKWEDYPKVRDYINFDGNIMMDSGAYQVMLYGDIELGVKDTLSLQINVDTDIGVIMDHPIGYDINFHEAKKRVDQTLENIEESIPYLDQNIIWTLPIQGGKYPSLMEYYLDEIYKRDYLDHFGMFALGSVVPVMINQDYKTLVDMIAIARKSLPEDKPLHLFGAGHPSIFALVTFLGCDSYDSAAYTLMAKDQRYMTTNGTYQLSDLIELPCSCKICSNYSVEDLTKLPKYELEKNISIHNLYVSKAEINNIKQHINDGNLWDLIMKRSSSVPNLNLATGFAIEKVTNGNLYKKYNSGLHLIKNEMLRIKELTDLKRPILKNINLSFINNLVNNENKKWLIIAISNYSSIYGKIPEQQIKKYDNKNYRIMLLIPAIGIIPYGISDAYPVGQMITEILIEDIPIDQIVNQIKLLDERDIDNLILYKEDDFDEFFEKLRNYVDGLKTIKVTSLITGLNNQLV